MSRQPPRSPFHLSQFPRLTHQNINFENEPPYKRQALEVPGSNSPINVSPAFPQPPPFQQQQVSSRERRNLEDFVESFAKDPTTDLFTFDHTLTSSERKCIHQSCLKWKLFSKSRGTGDNRTLTISKKELTNECEKNKDLDSLLDPTREHINCQIRDWLNSGNLEITVNSVTQPDLRYLYQLGTTFGFKPNQVEEGVVKCIRMVGDEIGKQFSYKTLFTKDVVDVKAISSVLDSVQKVSSAVVSLPEIPQNALQLIPVALGKPAVTQLLISANKLGEKSPNPEKQHIHPLPDLEATYSVNEEQKQTLLKFRQELPVFQLKDEIINAFKDSLVMVLSGQTGSGKTTQVPQMILDSGLLPPTSPVIICTQPRRIAAISVADRVSSERGQATGNEIGYQVRFDSAVSKTTKLVFMTPGILFRRMQSDPHLNGVGCIILDEVHERDVYTDFALLILKQMLINKTTQTKLVLMSATLQADAFVKYFSGVGGQVPFVNVEGRQFPVKDYYLEDALKWTGFQMNQIQTAVKGTEPPMDCHSVLVSDLTELQQVTNKSAMESLNAIMPRLRTALKKSYEIGEVKEIMPMPVTKGEKYSMIVRLVITDDKEDWKEVQLEIFKTELGQSTLAKVKTLNTPTGAPTPTATKTTPTSNTTPTSSTPSTPTSNEIKSTSESPTSSEPKSPNSISHVVPKPHIDLIAALIMFFHSGKQDGGILVFLPGMQDIKDVDWALRKYDRVRELWVLKLHSGLPPQEQKQVFAEPPVKGLRKVVLSTNMAESSVTVSDVVFVIDSGLMKERHYNPDSNVASLDCQFVSQVNVVQRRGRAGRVRAGVAVHLFPKAYYSKLTEAPVPELCRTPLEDVCLMVKSIGVGNIQDFIKNAMDPPLPSSVHNAVEFLTNIKALASNNENDITTFGRLLATFPVHAMLGRMLIFAGLFGVALPIATIVAAMTQRNPFNVPYDDNSRKVLEKAKQELDSPDIISDHVLLYHAIKNWEESPNKPAYAESHGMSNSALYAIRNTRDQLMPLLNKAFGADHSYLNRNQLNVKLIAAVVSMGLYPNTSWKCDDNLSHESESKAKKALTTPDGHRASCGRDSLAFDITPTSRNYMSYFERISHRGTLILQDVTVSGAIPLLLASKTLSVNNSTSTESILSADNILKVSCSSSFAKHLRNLHLALQGAIYQVSVESARQIPDELTTALIVLLSSNASIPPRDESEDTNIPSERPIPPQLQQPYHQPQPHHHHHYHQQQQYQHHNQPSFVSKPSAYMPRSMLPVAPMAPTRPSAYSTQGRARGPPPMSHQYYYDYM